MCVVCCVLYEVLHVRCVLCVIRGAACVLCVVCYTSACTQQECFMFYEAVY
jgi:hypothetical protein